MELRSDEDLQNELRQLLIKIQLQRLKYVKGVEDDVLCPLFTSDSISRDSEKDLLVDSQQIYYI